MWLNVLIRAAMVVLFVSAFVMPAVAETLIMPRELVEFAKQNGCGQLDDFFDRPEMVGPPYAYGYLPGPKERSAVLWCEARDRGKRQVFLLVMLRTPEQQSFEEAKCPRRIEWLGGYPGGLDISSGEESLERFVYLDSPKRAGPKGERSRGRAIRSAFEGTSSVLYCHKGRWLLRESD
jgi:hypothetical protein